ncbi:MAG: hypothetical protein M9910_06220 [Kiritimatiellae bacterium]|nr:hypothetical protein [Kiritimatiellia bacterium]
MTRSLWVRTCHFDPFIFPSISSTVTVQRCTDLVISNWVDVATFSTAYTNWMDYSATGEWATLYYRLIQE